MDELLAAYPEIPNAVVIVESLWDEHFVQYMGHPNFTVESVSRLLQKAGDLVTTRGCEAISVLARREMDLPQFARYIAGKMGAC